MTEENFNNGELLSIESTTAKRTSKRGGYRKNYNKQGRSLQEEQTSETVIVKTATKTTKTRNNTKNTKTRSEENNLDVIRKNENEVK